jgi:hypothetical protein
MKSVNRIRTHFRSGLWGAGSVALAVATLAAFGVAVVRTTSSQNSLPFSTNG